MILKVNPFLKWAGGKRWLLSDADKFFPDKNTMNRYFEPFLGGGSVFFHLEPANGHLSDVNEELINTYIVIRDDWKNLYDTLKNYQKKHSQEFYYRIRETNPRKPLQRAARFMYLNRTCWNGLYRVNKNGKFNVPIGTKTNVLLEDDNFERVSNLLMHTAIEVCDFETAINRVEENDFVYVDPPYTVKHNLNGFVKYNERIFSWQDQIRLKNAILKAVDRGAYVLVTNAHHKSITELYHGCGQMYFLSRASVIAGKSEARGVYSELAIKIW